MSKSRDRGKKIALASGLGVLAVAGMIVCFWDGLHGWYVGYRFVWLPEGAVTRNTMHIMNASGEVAVGLHPEGTRAGLWSVATRDVLPLDVPRPGGEDSWVLAINDAGDMVGVVSPVRWPSGDNPARAFLWTKDARVRDLPTLGGIQTVATAINERGQVVGWSTSPLNNVARACLWSADSGIADLGSLAPGMGSSALAINEAGWVVGSAKVANGSQHPFLWRREKGMQDLGLPPGFTGGEARDINDQGEVLVAFHYPRSILTPFVWGEREGLVKLPAPPGFDNVWPVALNNRGTVLLQALPADTRESFGYLIVNGVLKELPGALGAKSNRYWGLNDKGWIVGAAQKGEGTPWRGFVALPVR